MSSVFYGKSHNQQFVPDNKRAWAEYLSSVDGKALVVQIDQERWIRSASQNKFYWAYLRIIANETGNTEDDLHEYFKRIFLVPEYKTILGQEVKLPASTTKLNKAEMGEYLDKISALTNVPIPDPKLILN